MQQACDDSHKLTPFCNNLTERSLIVPCWRFTGIFRISFVKVQFFFNTPVTYFLKYFRAKFRDILMSGSRGVGVFPTVQFFIQLQFLTYYACVVFNWVLSVTITKLRIAGFFASLPFLTYLCNKRLKPSIQCVQLSRKIAKTVRVLSK